jgi:hypothetical protein
MGVPHIWKYVKTDENRKVVELIISQQVFQRSYIAPPGVTPEALGILRTAFDATMKDPQYLADADKSDRHFAAARRQGAGDRAEAARDLQGDRGAGARLDPAVTPRPRAATRDGLSAASR